MNSCTNRATRSYNSLHVLHADAVLLELVLRQWRLQRMLLVRLVPDEGGKNSLHRVDID